MPPTPRKPRMRLSCKHIVKLPRRTTVEDIRSIEERLANDEQVMADCPWHGPRSVKDLVP